jgi:Polyketide cyclase / dehydrase and lipid transport
MASIIRDTVIDAEPADVWNALADFGAVHERLVPGFVVESVLDGPRTRVVTFFNGVVSRVFLVGIEEDARRLAYAVTDGPLQATHHNASAQVVAEGGGRSRFIWITDVLPDELAAGIGEMMDRGIGVIKQTLELAART